jgi:ABC-type nitrate/sulfonate/bicarbonate transport system substrate-binding protein
MWNGMDQAMSGSESDSGRRPEGNVIIKKRSKITALLLMLTAFLSCSAHPPEQVAKIVLGAETVPHSSPIWIAENRGYFLEQGLTVEIKEFESGRTALRSMLDAEGIDIVTAAQTPVVLNSFSRNDYAIVGGMVYSENDVKLLARQDKGITAAADLKGKSVGMTAGSSGHFFLGLFMSYFRMRASDLRTVDLEPAYLSQALIEGRVDAIATWEPHIYNARKVLGDNAFLLSSGGIYRTDFYFVARKAFIQDNSDALRRFLRAIEKAEGFIRKNNKEAKEIVVQRLKMDRSILNETWDNFRFALFLDQSILTSLEDEARWAIRSRLTDASKVPNYLGYLHIDALTAVKPEAVQIAGD